MLARRALTHRELMDRLVRKGAGGDTAQAVVDELARLGYVNDAEITEDHIRRAREDRLLGRALVKFELAYKRGVDQELIDRAMAEFYPEESEFEVARRFATRKSTHDRDLPEVKRVRRLAGALERRGFPGEIVARLVRESKG